MSNSFENLAPSGQSAFSRSKAVNQAHEASWSHRHRSACEEGFLGTASDLKSLFCYLQMVASNDVYDSIPRSFTASLKKNDGDLVRPSLVSNPSNSEKNFTHKSFEVNSNLYENKYTKDCAIISNRNMKIRRSSDVQTSSNQRWLQNLYKKIEYEEKRFKEKVDLVTGRSVLQWYEANRANDAIVDARVEELRCIKSNHRDLDRISIRQSFIEILKNSQRRTLKEKLALTDTCDLIVESIDKNDEEKYTASLSKALPEGAADMIKEILKIRDKNHMVIKKFDIDFCVRDLITLKSPNWLNDEVINFYAQLLMYRSVKFNSSQADGKFFRKNFPTVHIFSTFFYPKLRDRGYQFVRTSTRRLNPPVLERDLILFPIHLGVHWCMAAIDMRERSITYYDSLHGNGDGCTKVLYDWIIAEAADKGFSLLGESIVDNNTGGSNDAIRPFYFDLRSPGDIPAQHNGYDCGVFSLVTAAHLCHGLSPRGFSQADMHYWRQRISFEIITGSLL